MEEQLKERNRSELRSEQQKKDNQLWGEWHKDTDNSYRSLMRSVIQELDVYLELMGDPEYALFIEELLEKGQSADIAHGFYSRLQDGAGLAMDGVDPIKGEITDLAEFRREFQRFVDEVKRVPQNGFAVEPLPGVYEEVLRRDLLNKGRENVLKNYRTGILPELLVTERRKHLQLLERIGRQFGWSTPLEIGQIEQQIESSRFIDPAWY